MLNTLTFSVGLFGAFKTRVKACNFSKFFPRIVGYVTIGVLPLITSIIERGEFGFCGIL